ncbi:MAG TPA: hypothetical protein VMT19_13315 [Thermoanaerobaculaceae bacterium]|nr:hypothetical protein [Thermoanaerobaculaceae bacterium]
MRHDLRTRKFVRFLVFLPLAVLFLALFGLVVMALWNWLMPALFGLKTLGYWQALGLVILCRILFGGRGSMGHGRRWRHRMHERWERMTPEERERFRQGLRDRWGCVPPPEPKPAE